MKYEENEGCIEISYINGKRAQGIVLREEGNIMSLERERRDGDKYIET